jgi:thermitase
MLLSSRQFKVTLAVFLVILVFIAWDLRSTASSRASAAVSPSPTATPAASARANRPAEKPSASRTPNFDPTSAPSSPPGNLSDPIPGPFSSPVFSPDQVLVKFDPSASKKSIAACLRSSSASLELEIQEINVLQVKVPAGQVARAVASLAACPAVVYAEPNYTARIADTIPLDPLWSSQYGLIAVHAPQGWDLSTGSAAVTIAIVDTGVDLSHADLLGKILPGYDFVNNDTIPQDDNGHGTHVAGIAAASSNNNIGIAGVSWGARILPVKVLNSSGNGSFADVALGIIWAANHGAQVINLSLGGYLPSSTLEEAVNYAYAQGVTLVAAAGNTGSNSVLYPARYPHVIAVAATDGMNQRAYFSNYGPEVDVSAPGVFIYSTALGNGYSPLSGTSLSAPFVSGLAAILVGLSADTSPDAITARIENTALDLGVVGRDDYYGFGLIQMDAAILPLIPTPTPTPTFTPSPTSTSLPSSTPSPTSIPTAVPLLPAAGFSPHRVTLLPARPAGQAYTDLGDLWLEIPRLAVDLPIVGVPQTAQGWDVSWLGDQAGWLHGTAFPTHAGNSVLSAHVYGSDGQPGLFVDLGTLVWGDQLIIHAFGQEYIYAVRETERVAPEAISSVLRPEFYPWLTLLTCQGYDETSQTYLFRVVVRAVQVAIR